MRAPSPTIQSLLMHVFGEKWPWYCIESILNARKKTLTPSMHLTLNQEAYLLTPGPLLTNNEVIHVKACLHVSFFGLCPLLPPLKFSIVPMVMV